MSFVYKPLERLANYVAAPSRVKYAFGLSEGSKEDVELLSVKGANLCEIFKGGYRVPPAFILSTEASIQYRKSNLIDLETNLLMEINFAIRNLESATGREFGNMNGTVFPLLLTLRGGSVLPLENLVGEEESTFDVGSIGNEIMDILGVPDSWCFPGMKESCLGIGLTDKVVEQIAQHTSRSFAYNAYSHFLIRYGTIVLNIPKSAYRNILSEVSSSSKKSSSELSEQEVLMINQKFKEITPLPQDPFEQLGMAVRAMYDSWFDMEATTYRSEALNMPADKGLALIIQTLVLGDTGVVFSRNPITGEMDQNLSGCIWTKDGKKLSIWDYSSNEGGAVHRLHEIVRLLELLMFDMVQIEFVIDDEKQINLLQILPARRTPHASIRVAVDLNKEFVLSEREALLRINGTNSHIFWHYDMKNKLESDVIGHGETSSRGIVVGAIAFNAVDGVALKSTGQNVILVQLDTDSTDERVLALCDGLILLFGNVLSPPASLCRALGKPCLTNVSGFKLQVWDEMQFLEVNEYIHLGRGSIITMNCSTGKIYGGPCKKIPNYGESYFMDVLKWAENFRSIRIESKLMGGNIVEEIRTCFQEGSDGIGNLPTDWMFANSEERLNLTRLILISRSPQDRKQHMDTLENWQKQDFVEIIEAVLADNKNSYNSHISLKKNGGVGALRSLHSR